MKKAIGVAIALLGAQTAYGAFHIGNPTFWIEGNHTTQVMDCTTEQLTTVSNFPVTYNSSDDNICEIVFRSPHDNIVISNQLPANHTFILKELQ